jgi:threonine dehydratase
VSSTLIMLTLDHILAAADRLKGEAVRTPLLRSDELDRRTGGRLLVKAEPLQRTGSFKFRGAYNAIAQIAAPAVVAFSSGNHAQGVALAARLLGKHATIVMPKDAPRAKLDGTRRLGAEVITYDRWGESREAIGAEVAARTGAEIVRPYDDLRVMAGQGTVGLEIGEQAAELGLSVDIALAPASGGGLLAGVATALVAHFPAAELYVAEPAGFEDHALSLRSGQRERHSGEARTICDALMAPTPGELTFPINRRLLRGGVIASDDEVRDAIRTAFSELKVVVEPGGAVALAAVLAGRIDCRDRTVAVVLSGGNIDPSLYAEILSEAS